MVVFDTATRNDKQGGAERQEQERELKKLQEQKELLLASLAEARSQLAKVEIDLERTKTDLETEGKSIIDATDQTGPIQCSEYPTLAVIHLA